MDEDDSARIEQAAAEWLARRDADAWSARDRHALQAWLDASTRHRVAYLRLESAWREAGRLRALAAGRPEGIIPPRGQWGLRASTGADLPSTDALPGPPDLRGLAFAPRPRGSARPGPWRRAAAAAVACLAIGALGWGGWQASGRHAASYASSMGEVADVVLDDGSTVTLSSDSRVDVLMTRGQRHVALARGEAFFDVAHDTGRPFVVEAEGRNVRAVGTRFSVRRDADALRVVVTEGRVRLDGAPAADGRLPPAALLPAGSVATAGRNGVLVRSLPLAEAERLLEWRDGFLTFDDTTLADAAAEFNRYSARRLELGDPAVGALRVGGNFRWSNADAFASLLELGFPVRAERHPDRIVLHMR